MYFIVTLLPFLIAILAAAMPKLMSKYIGFIALPVPIVIFAYYFICIPKVISGEIIEVSRTWIPYIGLNYSLQLTPLSLIFSLIISFVGIIVLVYSHSYLSKKENLKSYYIYLLMFMGAMLGIVNANNLILLYICWEVTSVTSFLLIGFWHENEKSRYGANKALLITVAGGFCMLVGFMMVGSVVGSYEISEILASGLQIKNSNLYESIAILILLGAFTKSAQVPFHIWLPSAMEAPTPISCYLHSATMVKGGVYLIALFSPIMGGEDIWDNTTILVGLSSLVFGSFMALKSDDLKAIFAYHSISQIGLIISLFGMGTQAAFVGALLHTAFHSAFKGSLFLMTGIVDHQTHTRKISQLGGLGKYMPVTAIICFIGCFSMSGIPPFAGFMSKEMFLDASYEMIKLGGLGQANYMIPVLAAIGSLGTLLCAISTFFRVFVLRNEEGLPTPKVKEGKLGLLLPALVLVSMNIALPQIINWYLPDLNLSLWHGITPAVVMSCIIWILGIIILKNFNWFHHLINKGKMNVGMNKLYDKAIPAITTVSKKVTKKYMTGNLTNYLSYIIVGAMILTLLPILTGGVIQTITFDDLANVEMIEVVLVVIIATAAVLAAKESNAIKAILFLGVCGYGISVFFVLFSAPDLALAQLLIETITLVLYILAMRLFPKKISDNHKRTKSKSRGVRLAISVAAGATVFLFTLVANSNKFYESISSFFTENSQSLAGGDNVVNLILVDFRAVNTMGEVVVMAIAAVAVMVLIHLWTDKKGITRAYSITYGLEYKMPRETHNHTILLTMAKPLAVIVLCISAFLFISGHYNPGGGLIAGITAVCATLILYVTYGKKYIMTIPYMFNLEKVLVVGVLISATNGLIGMVLSDEFMTQYIVKLSVPLLGTMKFATSVMFDAGVYLVVIAAVMSIILNIGKIEE